MVSSLLRYPGDVFADFDDLHRQLDREPCFLKCYRHLMHRYRVIHGELLDELVGSRDLRIDSAQSSHEDIAKACVRDRPGRRRSWTDTQCKRCFAVAGCGNCLDSVHDCLPKSSARAYICCANDIAVRLAS